MTFGEEQSVLLPSVWLEPLSLEEMLPGLRETGGRRVSKQC